MQHVWTGLLVKKGKWHLPTYRALSILFQIEKKKCFPNTINNSHPSFSNSWWSFFTKCSLKESPQLFAFPGFFFFAMWRNKPAVLPVPKNFLSAPLAIKAGLSLQLHFPLLPLHLLACLISCSPPSALFGFGIISIYSGWKLHNGCVYVRKLYHWQTLIGMWTLGEKTTEDIFISLE